MNKERLHEIERYFNLIADHEQLVMHRGKALWLIAELKESQQKVERLEKAMKENLTPATYYVIQQIALETENPE